MNFILFSLSNTAAMEELGDIEILSISEFIRGKNFLFSLIMFQNTITPSFPPVNKYCPLGDIFIALIL